jgi:very-short-patch-repair endonuclease
MDDNSMFYGARKDTFRKAFMLRRNETAAEKILWERLRKNQLCGFRFKRQHPIGGFIADFYCHKAKLVIEIDGQYHNRVQQKQYDRERTNVMIKLGLSVIRFSNHDVFVNADYVIEEIKKYLPI